MYFHEIGFIYQVILLILSQFSMIMLATGIIFLYKRKESFIMQLVMCNVFFINMILYVLMQLQNRLISNNSIHIVKLPYIFILSVTIVSLVFVIWKILNETINKKTLSHHSIKGSFDNLPTGVCYFNESGLPVLCNHIMHEFSFAVSGKDIQYITDLENCLMDNFKPSDGTKKEGNVFILSNKSAWQMEKRIITNDDGTVFTQYVASDVTDLYRNQKELIKENEHLSKLQEELQTLSANVVIVTREEEILNTKMRVHDEMGRCLIAAQKYLLEEQDVGIPDSIAHSWKRAVSMVKYNNDMPNEDMLTQIRKACDSVKLSFIQSGEIPQSEKVAYIFTCAIRECVTNAVRYAKADALYANFGENENEYIVTITNSGNHPASEIVEGGGLSTLRHRVERAGGTMSIQSTPYFELTVKIPKEMEEII